MMGRIVCMQVKIYTIELSIKLSLCPNTSSGLDCLKKLCIFPYLTVQLGFSSISFHRITNKLRTNSSSIPDDIKEQLSTLYQNPTPRACLYQGKAFMLFLLLVTSTPLQFSFKKPTMSVPYQVCPVVSSRCVLVFSTTERWQLLLLWVNFSSSNKTLVTLVNLLLCEQILSMDLSLSHDTK